MASLREYIWDGPTGAGPTLVLAHGAGAGMDSPFMAYFAEELAKHGRRVARFEFPYMAARRRTQKRKPPDRTPVLLASWEQVIDELGNQELVIGGKSMGGRLASMVADAAQVAGLVCLGYPFHPSGKPERPRIDHLRQLATPAMVVQGERDPFGRREEVEQYDLSRQLQIHWLADGDHSFKPRRASGRTQLENWQEGVRHVDRFLKHLGL